ncbi:MAG: right-handed parallel beta-helix repeat-containing protein [Planctomycetes bacterium]|nr:right-handed parallel beta-helix repeat-containing protein [Planctomycetota bacterium]
MQDDHPENKPEHPPTLPTDRRAMLAGLGGLAAGALLAGKANAGPLNPPPGPIAPTPGPEPRIPVNAQNTPGDTSATFRITQPGSYYLEDNIIGQSGRHGIMIIANNVTLDLMGFQLQGVPGSRSGVFMPNYRIGVVIRNGQVSNWGEHGLLTAIDDGAIERVHAHSNRMWGISNQDGFMLRVNECGVHLNGSLTSDAYGGIRAGESSLIYACAVRENRGIGVSVGSGSTVSQCTVSVNRDTGILAAKGSLVTHCTITRNGVFSGLHGLQLARYCVARSNLCSDNGDTTSGAGIFVDSGQNNICIEENTCNGNSIGIRVVSPGNFIARNSCSGNAFNWSIAPNNICLVVNASPSLLPILGNSGGTSPGSTNPNANYTY